MSEPEVSRAEFVALVAKVDEHMAVTKEVRDILATFNVLFRVAKFVAAVAVAITAVVTFFRTLKGGI